jgi:hypothetical protein
VPGGFDGHGGKVGNAGYGEAGIRQAEKRGHGGMAEDLRAALASLGE